LNLCHSRVRLSAEAQLNLDKRFEAGIEIGNTKIDELGEFAEELLVELLISCLGHICLLLSAGKFGNILVRLLNELLNLRAHRVVVEQFVITLFDTYDLSALNDSTLSDLRTLIDVREVCAKSRDGFENGRTVEH
jgi:hypothetical protein